MTDQDSTQTLGPGTTVVADEADVLVEAVGVIDAALAKMMQRELVSSGEVADLLLDLRMLLQPVS
jgi:hypothetical protein